MSIYRENISTPDQRFRLVQLPADQLHDVDVTHLVMSTNVVDFTSPALVDDEINRLAMILHI